MPERHTERSNNEQNKGINIKYPKNFRPKGIQTYSFPKEKSLGTDVGREGHLEAKGREDVNKQGYSSV